GPNASMKQLNDQIRIINTGLIRLQMTALATVATFGIFTAAMWKAAKGPDPSDIRKQQQAITDEYNKQYQKRIDEVYNFAGLFDKVSRETFSGK
ncbi:tail length tape measure protein, partial [Bacillus cereus]